MNKIAQTINAINNNTNNPISQGCAAAHDPNVCGGGSNCS